ncbi:hypothetical protein C8R47DRAFT_1136156 [Mycena vitilis]|nr:hypothetical protein C8R47DRAFT_1136156 [Mycena vitilis]
MEAKLKTPTCSRCKTRKIRCDGLDPCYSCSTASATCHYEGGAKESRFGFELRKGQACLACRRKKKRCDGQQPCRTCASGRKKIPCEYPDGMVVTLPLEKVDERVVRTDMHSTDSESPDSFQSSSSEITPMVLSSGSSATSSTGSPGEIPVFPNDMDLFDLESPSPFTDPDIAMLPVNYTTLADLSEARDLFLDNTGKRNLASHDEIRVSVEVPPAQVAETPNQTPAEPPHPFLQVALPTQAPQDEVEELAGIRRLFLHHRTQLGLSVPDDTTDAILQGVADGIVLHPVLLHVCTLIGYMLAHQLQNRAWICLPDGALREAEQLRLTLEALHETTHSARALPPSPGAPPRAVVACLQAVTLLSTYYFNKGDVARARELILTGSALVRRYDLDGMAREPPPPPDPSLLVFKIVPGNLTGETQAAISQLVFTDLSYAVTLKIPSIIDPTLRDNFKTLINRPNAHVESNFVRAKSAALLYETQQLTAQWCRQPGLTEAETVEWQRTYWETMEALDAQRSVVAFTLTKMAFCPSLNRMALSMKVCALLVQTGLAALLSLFSASHPELKQKKYAAIGEIISISSLFTDEDCEFLDPILSACWTAIVGTLDQCIALGPEATAESMHDLPAMAVMIRKRNKALQRGLPFAVDA